MRDTRLVIAAAALVSLAGAARAETACGAQASLFASEAGLKVWVTRKGSIVPDDPLRPLSKKPLLVLQVVVNGRSVTAYGPNESRLVQARGTREIEETYGGPVRWNANADGLQDTLGVSSPDGGQVLGPLRFQECGDPRSARARGASGSGASARKANEPPASVLPEIGLRPSQ